MRAYAEMAKTIADALDDATLVELQEMLDGDTEDELWAELTSIVRARHPELFDDPLDLPKAPPERRRWTKTTTIHRAVHQSTYDDDTLIWREHSLVKGCSLSGLLPVEVRGHLDQDLVGPLEEDPDALIGGPMCDFEIAVTATQCDK